jgi:hypothetical protein
LNPTLGAAPGFGAVVLPNRFEVNGAEVGVLDLLRLPNKFDVGAFVGVAAVMFTVGVADFESVVGVAAPNLIGLSGFHV